MAISGKQHVSRKPARSKADRVAGSLRQEIISGRLSPGAMLPKWDDLQTQFRVCRPTLTQAVEGLKRDGFVRTHRSQGTFVHDRPPHLVRFGIVFASGPSRGLLGLGGWNQFWDHLAKAAPLVEREFGVELPVFYDVCDERSPGHAALEHAVRRQTVGGLIIVGTPSLLYLPTITEFALPKVAIFDSADGLEIGCPQLYFDFESFVARSLEMVKAQGRRRVAFFHVPGDAKNTELEALRRRGIANAIPGESIDGRYLRQMSGDDYWQTPDHWHFQVGRAGIGNVVRLLLDRPAAERPDALVVSDDNLVPAVLAGVIAAGVRVPDELLVLTHVNWPTFGADVVPVQRLGFDVRSLLRRCVETIAAVRAGDTVPPMQRLPALIEAEASQLAWRSELSTDNVAVV